MATSTSVSSTSSPSGQDPPDASGGASVSPVAACQRPPRQVAQGCRHGAAQRRGHVVPGLGDPPAGIGPPRIVGPVLARVPASAGHIDAAAERQGIVHDHHLLMMRRASGMMAVEREADAARRELQTDRLNQLLAQLHEHRLVPLQDVERDVRGGPDDVLEEVAQPVRHPVRGEALGVALAGDHLQPQVEIPADHVDRPLRRTQRRPQVTEVVRPVDDHRQAIRALDPPAGLVGDQEARMSAGRFVLVRVHGISSCPKAIRGRLGTATEPLRSRYGSTGSGPCRFNSSPREGGGCNPSARDGVQLCDTHPGRTTSRPASMPSGSARAPYDHPTGS